MPRRTTAARGSRSGGGGWRSPTKPFHGWRWCEHPGTTAPVETLWRGQRLRALAELPELIAAGPDGPDGRDGYQLAVIRYGQLAAAGTAGRGVPPMPVVDAISAGAQAILRVAAPLGGALVEETALIARWLATPGVRIVRVSEGGWASPLRSARAWAAWAAAARSARLAGGH